MNTAESVHTVLQLSGAFIPISGASHKMEVKTFVVVLIVSHYATAHICLLSPRQRGAMDISVVSNFNIF